jgi:uncharacterized damage-inducible protein DinB
MTETRNTEPRNVEPWLSGTLTELPPLERAVVHSLQMAHEDITKWCGDFDDQQIHARPLGLPSIAFQIRHIARSLDRFCTYAEGSTLTSGQLAALAAEIKGEGSKAAIFEEFEQSLQRTRERLGSIVLEPQDKPIAIGRKRLPTTLAGLLVHAAEHAQRHVGQAVTTAKVLRAQSDRQCDPSSPA